MHEEEMMKTGLPTALLRSAMHAVDDSYAPKKRDD
jgi:hypothetical protein